jgi:hypothetical protein
MEGIGIHATYFWTITGLKGRKKDQDRVNFAKASEMLVYLF